MSRSRRTSSTQYVLDINLEHHISFISSILWNWHTLITLIKEFSDNFKILQFNIHVHRMKVSLTPDHFIQRTLLPILSHYSSIPLKDPYKILIAPLRTGGRGTYYLHEAVKQPIVRWRRLVRDLFIIKSITIRFIAKSCAQESQVMTIGNL